MSDLNSMSLQNLDPRLSVEIEPEEPDDQSREVLDLIRGKAANARAFYRRTHAIVQEAHRLIEQASAKAKNAEIRAAAIEIALKAAEERALRAEDKNLQLTAQLGAIERHRFTTPVRDAGQTPTSMRRIRPTLPICPTAKSQSDVALRRIWPFK